MAAMNSIALAAVRVVTRIAIAILLFLFQELVSGLFEQATLVV
jgi:hypothetical protein